MFRTRLEARFALAIFLIVTAVSTAAFAQNATDPLLREQRTVVVQGDEETWQLVWDETPSDVCGPGEVYMAITCPCSGFAYGQSGKLSLIRLRGGREVERMDLGPLFVSSDLPEKEGVEGQAVLARWPVADGAAKRASQGDPKLVAEIERRPAPVVMRLGDYDRGGQATEFLIEVGTLPCGKLQFAAVEVSAKQPRLHVLSSIDQPDTPLVMPLSAWQALQQRPGPSTVHTWDCGDHGSETSTELVVAARDGQIRVEERESACSP